MSYEIVRNLRLAQNENGTWYAVIKSACNNVYPRTPREWNYAKEDNYTKEQLEKELVKSYLWGNLQKGSNVYFKATRLMELTEEEKIEKARLNGIEEEETKKARAEFDSLYPTYKDAPKGEYDRIYKKSRELYEIESNYEKDCYYKHFLEIKPTLSTKKTVVKCDSYSFKGYIANSRARNRYFSTTDIAGAKVFTDKIKLDTAVRCMERNNIKYELIAV